MLSDRSGAFEAIANSSIKLARVAPEEVDELVAEAILQFGGDGVVRASCVRTPPRLRVHRLPAVSRPGRYRRTVARSTSASAKGTGFMRLAANIAAWSSWCGESGRLLWP